MRHFRAKLLHLDTLRLRLMQLRTIYSAVFSPFREKGQKPTPEPEIHSVTSGTPCRHHIVRIFLPLYYSCSETGTPIMAASEDDLEKFVSRADKAEKEVEELIRELECLEPQVPAAAKRNGKAEEEEEVPEELAKLRTENTKLKYRLGILQRATEKEEARGKSGGMASPSKRAKVGGDGGGMYSILAELTEVFKEAVGLAFPDLPDAPAPVTGSAKFGDYQFNGAMAIAGLFKVCRTYWHIVQGLGTVNRLT